jgi:hypothetical protein
MALLTIRCRTDELDQVVFHRVEFVEEPFSRTHKCRKRICSEWDLAGHTGSRRIPNLEQHQTTSAPDLPMPAQP